MTDHELTALRAQLEAVTRERDAKEREIQRLLNVVCSSPACTAAVVRRDDGSRVCAAGHPARWVNIDLLCAVERERDDAREELEKFRALGGGHAAFAYANVAASVERAESCVSDDEARQLRALAAAREAEVARLREALTQVRDAMLATGQGPDGDDDPRRPLATAVWSAPASTPAPGPTRAEAEAWVGDGEAASGMLAHSAESAPGPTEREMRVAEAVRTQVARHIRTSPKFEGQLTTPADGGLLGRVAQDVENFDLRAIAAKAVGS